jgi:hypothetical protein
MTPLFLESLPFAGITIFDADSFVNLALRFAINFTVGFIAIYFIYAKRDLRNSEFAFNYFVFNSMVFFLTYLLEHVQMDLGFAFGLFAVFSILRYRTLPIPIREMTYLFILIGLAVINALSVGNISMVELLFSNLAILGVTWLGELTLLYRLAGYKANKRLDEKVVQYEKIELVVPARKAEMLEDLKTRTGLDIQHFSIEEFDFMKDTATVRIYFVA